MTDTPLIIGSRVTYHGTLTAEHGRAFLVLPCRCDDDDDCDDERWNGGHRYALLATDGGKSLVHVRPRSFTVEAGHWWPDDAVPVEHSGEHYRAIYTRPAVSPMLPVTDGWRRMYYAMADGEPGCLVLRFALDSPRLRTLDAR